MRTDGDSIEVVGMETLIIAIEGRHLDGESREYDLVFGFDTLQSVSLRCSLSSQSTHLDELHIRRL